MGIKSMIASPMPAGPPLHRMWAMTFQASSATFSNMKYENTSTGDPAKDAVFLHCMSTYDDVPYVDATSHCHSLEARIEESLTEAHPNPTRCLSNVYGLASEAQHAIRLKSSSPQLAHRMQRRFSKTVLFVSFCVWSRATWRAKWSAMCGLNRFDNVPIVGKDQRKLGVLNQQTRSLVRLEWLARVGCLVDELADAVLAGSTSKMYSALSIQSVSQAQVCSPDQSCCQ